MEETHEIAIVCFPESSMDISLSKLTFTVKAILIFTSVLFLLLTLYVYFRLSELRETQVDYWMRKSVSLEILIVFQHFRTKWQSSLWSVWRLSCFSWELCRLRHRLTFLWKVASHWPSSFIFSLSDTLHGSTASWQMFGRLSCKRFTELTCAELSDD